MVLLDGFWVALECLSREAQGECKGLGATPRFALYVVRTKPLALSLLLAGIAFS
jgi:ABC-type proline/glycine betaine transport system permease subunit